jgi:hypothetical protein
MAVRQGAGATARTGLGSSLGNVGRAIVGLAERDDLVA